MSEPWVIESELTSDRLYNVAQIMQSVRDGTVEEHDPGLGDGRWSLGCRVYERTINVLEAYAEEVSWLTVHKQNLYCLLVIGGVPVRFYTGEPQRPNKRTLKRAVIELECLEQLELNFGQRQEKYSWRIAVEKDLYEHRTLRIMIAQFDQEGSYRNPWEIPLDVRASHFGMIGDHLAEAVDLPAPVVSGVEELERRVASNE